jgi:uncharacterized protein
VVSIRSVGRLFFILVAQNTYIDSFAPMQVTARADVGAVFENCMIVERMKAVLHRGGALQQFYWRTIDQQEVDYIEQSGGTLTRTSANGIQRKT